MSAQPDIVAEFINELVPKNVVEAAQLLVSLSYPIPDKKSLMLQLEKRKTNNPQDQKSGGESSDHVAALIDYVAGGFKPADFGLDTPQSALEKFFDRPNQDCSCASQSFIPVNQTGLPDLPFGEPPFFVPTTPEQIELAFGTDECGRAAAERWRAHLNSPLARAIGPSPAEYVDIRKDRLRLCRGHANNLGFVGNCGDSARDTFARCFVNADSLDWFTGRGCAERARAGYDRCRARVFGPDVPGPFPGR